MTKFETDGFLSTELTGVEREIRAQYDSRFKLAVDANRLTHRVIYAVKPNSENVPDLMLATLLIRAASSYQSFLVLLGKGLETQAQILLRNLAELMFIVGAIRKDSGFVKQYVLSEDVSRVKSLEAIVKDKRSRGEDIEKETLELIKKLRAKISDEELTSFSTERIAQIAGLSSYYDTLYRFASMAVHVSPRELNSAFQLDSSGSVVSLNYGPAVEGFGMYFDYAISMMLFTLYEIAGHFKIEVTAEIEALQHLNRKLAGRPTDGMAGT